MKAKKKSKPRPRGSRPTPLATYTLPADLKAALEKLSLATDVPRSRYVAEGLAWRLAQPDAQIPAT